MQGRACRRSAATMRALPGKTEATTACGLAGCVVTLCQPLGSGAFAGDVCAGRLAGQSWGGGDKRGSGGCRACSEATQRASTHVPQGHMYDESLQALAFAARTVLRALTPSDPQHLPCHPPWYARLAYCSTLCIAACRGSKS